MSVDTHARTKEFAQEIRDLLEVTLPLPDGDHPSWNVRCVCAPKGLYAVHPGDDTHLEGVKHSGAANRSENQTAGTLIPLLSNGEQVAGFRFRFLCTSDTHSCYLAVRKSTFELVGPGGTDNNAPILRLDYDRSANNAPSAHWNVHAERGAISHILARTNPSHSGMLSKIHLSVGGARARPCLEDFLQMLFDDFNFDKCSGAKKAIEDGRMRWRRMQIATLVRDAPEVAVETLRGLGYTVTPPMEGERMMNVSSMRRC